jgi:hypothetical protein
MKEEELRTNLLKSSKFKPQPVTSPVEVISKTKDYSLKKSFPMKQGLKEESYKKTEIKSPCNGSKVTNTNDSSSSMREVRSSVSKCNSIDSSQPSLFHSAAKTSLVCSRCKKKRVCNVRIQCKVDQYLSSKLPLMRKEISLSLKIPRIPLPAYELSHLKYGKFFRLEEHSNGGGKTLRLYWDEIINLSPEEKNELAWEFLEESFK